MSLDAKFTPSAPKLVSGGNFTPSPRHPSSHTSKTTASRSRNWVNFTEFSHSCLWLGSDIGISNRTFLWTLLNPLEGLWRCPQPGFPLKGCWHWPVLFWTVQSPGGDGPGLAPQYHFHLSNKTSKVWVFLKANVQVPTPSLISPITLTVLPQQEKKLPKPNTKTPFSISYLGGGLVSLKPLTGFQYSFILRKHLLYEAWALAGTAEAWPVQRRRQY